MNTKRPALGLLAALVLTFMLAACGESPAQLPASAQRQAALPTATAVPSPTATATPPPTATLAANSATEWGVIKSIGAEVKSEPNTSSTTIEKLSGFTLVAFQRKLIDESWWERAGGGWLAKNDMTIYRTEVEARRAVPQPTAAPTAVPTFNPSPAPASVPDATLNSGIGAPGAPGGIATKPAVQNQPVQTSKPAPTVAVPVAKPPAQPSGVRIGAVCNDGSRSNATGSGACSSHKGVNYWLCTGDVRCA